MLSIYQINKKFCHDLLELKFGKKKTGKNSQSSATLTVMFYHFN